MRKALIGLILAATIMTPIAAQAQERGERRSRHVQQEDNAGSGQQGERRAQRSEARQQREAVSQQRQGAHSESRGHEGGRFERRQRANQGAQTVHGWAGPDDARFREHRERYNRLARENAMRHGTEEQRREVRQLERQERREDRREWRDDRRDWRGDRRDDRRDWRDDRRDDRRDWRRDWREDRREWRQDRRRDWNRHWNRGWRHDRRYDWNRWRYSNRHLYRLPPYYAPYRGHRYSRFSVGLILDSLLFDRRYWIDNPYHYRLPPAPPGTQWVRYYNDVLLVDTWSGEVIDVIYNFFW